MQNLTLGKTYSVNFGTFIFIGIYTGMYSDLHEFEYISNEGYGKWHSSIFQAENSQICTLVDNISYEYW